MFVHWIYVHCTGKVCNYAAGNISYDQLLLNLVEDYCIRCDVLKQKSWFTLKMWTKSLYEYSTFSHSVPLQSRLRCIAVLNIDYHDYTATFLTVNHQSSTVFQVFDMSSIQLCTQAVVTLNKQHLYLYTQTFPFRPDPRGYCEKERLIWLIEIFYERNITNLSYSVYRWLQ